MKIQVGGLSEGIHRYQFRSSAVELDLGSAFKDEMRVEATLEKTGNQFFLNATIATVGTFLCDRCATEFSGPISPQYRMVYVQDGIDSAQLDPSEVQVIPAGLNIIDLDEDVRQTVLLSVPLKLLCNNDCRGLCSHCGKNRNSESCSCSDAIPDSRWEKLRSLQNNQIS